MEQAIYFSSSTLPRDQFRHYGLAVDIYTHFTSPIRRYADDLVHRLLAAAMDIEPLAPKVTDKNYMTQFCNHMNQRHRGAQYASRASVELYTLTYFKNRAVAQSAYISKVKENAVFVYVPRYGIENIVYVSDAKDDEEKNSGKSSLWEYDDENEQLKHKQNKQLCLKVFDKVKVQIYVKTSKNYRSKLIMEIIDPALSPMVQNIALEEEEQSTRKRKLEEVEQQERSKAIETKKPKN